ncbi:sensor histidine kinase [Amycolatopsis magusensis]|uniref:histidine kinase n=2 Tax=Amycolatopsis magusensis TaxID=882444 RepID=A0ABS4Q5V7_9PSEU|nr:sensor histidine kinase [Amycolatopsis magusensis]MBP2187066.1 signal transduction histidine kinase [Amycolatopsis magusensis]MDI5979768.1 sensor histidine kinase [Amycolatopsis magusensis]
MSQDGAAFTQPKPHWPKVVGFMVASFPLRLVQFVLLVTLAAVGIGTVVVWVGVPLLVLVTGLTRWFGDVERRWVRKTLDTPLPDAVRLPQEGTWLQRWRTRLTDQTTWRDFGYLMLALPLGIVEFALGIAGIVLFPIAIWVLPWVAWLHGNLALSLLGPPRNQQLAAKAEHLQASRARGVDAAEAERRRIERDLHDGAQQRLVSVAMSLGRAKSKFENDPEAVRELIDEAHSDAKLAVSELRDLARGIYPAVLGDRGLDAALSAQAAKSPVPVEVSVDVQPRPPAAVETTAYFIVGETLTNIAKHSGATQAVVKVWRTEDRVIVEITDNGHGGAEVRTGGGLAGLADRAATIDGVITVVSPPGGPTVVRSDLPCTW